MASASAKKLVKGVDFSSKAELQLAEDIGAFFADPLGFVLYAFPWGEAGTRLANQQGPDTWQRELMENVGRLIRKNMAAGKSDGEAVGSAIQYAIASGHGIGKSAMVSWIILWFISTREFPQIVVTANTAAQLRTKTWRELAKWWRLALNGHWFNWSATSFYHVAYPDTWFAAAIPWSIHNAEAFAGTHEEHVLVIYDEASGIEDLIWEVTSGAMTTPGAMWFCFGNPTRNTGNFHGCFNRNKHRWHHKQIDSRSAKMADGKKIDEWVQDYGEDSDFVRVRVRGLFPRAGSNQLINSQSIRQARARRIEGWESAPKIMAVDVARHGDDESVFTYRQGKKVHPQARLRITDLMQLAARIVSEYNRWHPDALFIDATGIGWGVVDRVRELGVPCIAVQTGEAAQEDERYYNKRAELWVRMRDWIDEGADLPEEDQALEDDLVGPEYGFDNRMRIQLEKKEDMKKRGLGSPDGADSLALTFAQPVSADNNRGMDIPHTRNWRVM